MTKRKKIVTGILLGIVLLAACGVCVLFLLGFFQNTDPVYGKYSYQNADGSMATISLSETEVTFENINFDHCEVNAAYFMLRDRYAQAEKKIDPEQFEQEQKALVETLDFKRIFDGKTLPVSDSTYIEDENQYYYYINTAETGEYGLSICMDLASHSLSLSDMEFSYQK